MMKIKYLKRREDTKGQRVVGGECGRKREERRHRGAESEVKLHKELGSRMNRMRRRRSQKWQQKVMKSREMIGWKE